MTKFNEIRCTWCEETFDAKELIVSHHRDGRFVCPYCKGGLWIEEDLKVPWRLRRVALRQHVLDILDWGDC